MLHVTSKNIGITKSSCKFVMYVSVTVNFENRCKFVKIRLDVVFNEYLFLISIYVLNTVECKL